MRGRRDVLRCHFTDPGYRADDDVELRGIVIQFVLAQVEPGQMGRMGRLVAGDGRHGATCFVRWSGNPAILGRGHCRARPRFLAKTVITERIRAGDHSERSANAASGPPDSSVSNPASSKIGTPSCTALSCFDPGLSPTTTKSVFWDPHPGPLP